GSLCHAINADAAEGDARGDRADIDDLPAALGFHHRVSGLAEEQQAAEIDGEDRVELLLGYVGEGVADVDAGAVDEDVESAELAAGVVDESLAGGDVGDIGLHYDGTPAGGFNLLSRLRQVRLVAAMNTDGRPRPAEC